MSDSLLSGSVLVGFVLADFVSFDPDQFGTILDLEHHNHHQQTGPVLFDSVFFGFVLSDPALSYSVFFDCFLYDLFLYDFVLVGFVLSGFVSFDFDQFWSCCCPVLDLEHHNPH